MKPTTCLLASLALVLNVLALGCGSVSSGGDGGPDGAGHGTTGAAGMTGAAGTTGAAGHGTAGTTGAAGHDGGAADSGASCTDLQSQYGEAFVAARMCNVGAANQCAQPVSSSLSPCFSNCMIYVNDASTLNAIKTAWLAAGCANQGPIACPAIACIQPSMGNCVASDGGGGVCSSIGIGPVGASTN
jgi:hypothetical protein